jgi:hypothetical protein
LKPVEISSRETNVFQQMVIEGEKFIDPLRLPKWHRQETDRTGECDGCEGGYDVLHCRVLLGSSNDTSYLDPLANRGCEISHKLAGRHSEFI